MKFSIPSPCSENWDGMMPTACGRFCAHCQKEVIDVTEMDDTAILQKYEEQGGDLCIRARTEQVSPQIRVRVIPMQRLAVFAVAVWLVFSCSLVTEKKPEKRSEPINIHKGIFPNYRIKHATLMVKVVNERNEPIPNAQVQLSNLEQTQVSDQNGLAVFDQVPMGRRTMHLFQDGRDIGSQLISIEPRMTNYIEIRTFSDFSKIDILPCGIVSGWASPVGDTISITKKGSI